MHEVKNIHRIGENDNSNRGLSRRIESNEIRQNSVSRIRNFFLDVRLLGMRNGKRYTTVGFRTIYFCTCRQKRILVAFIERLVYSRDESLLSLKQQTEPDRLLVARKYEETLPMSSNSSLACLSP